MMDYSKMSNEELNQLANQKDGDAICELGERYLNGTKGCERNLTKAYRMFHRAEKMGLEKGYQGLGFMYENGLYFAQNKEIANKYYQKAGGRSQDMIKAEQQKMLPVQPSSMTTDFVREHSSTPSESAVDVSEISQRIERAERARQQGNYSMAKKECHEVIKLLQDVENGLISISEIDDLDVWRINAYWILAFTAFNEQNISELEEYTAKEGVLGLYPWGAYLVAVLHSSMSYSNVVLEHDLQTLILVSHNMNLTTEQRGDICAMIGDFIVQGVGAGAGHDINEAYQYYKEAADCGSSYAVERMNSL